MKKLLFLVFVLITANAFSQKVSLEKLWVGDNNEYLLADSSVIRFETFSKSFGNTRIAKWYVIKPDTLRIFEHSPNDTIGTADFLITTIKKNELILTPTEVNATLLTNYITHTGIKKQLHFIEISQVYTDTIQFEKIIFNATNCYGRCPAMSLLIDNKKQVQFIGQKFAVKQGFFHSTIPDSLFNELIQILKLSELDRIECNNYKNIDAPTFTLEIHYNNKIKYLESCMLPFVTNELLMFLLALPGQLKLVEARDKFDIKFGGN